MLFFPVSATSAKPPFPRISTPRVPQNQVIFADGNEEKKATDKVHDAVFLYGHHLQIYF
jgi:hypothetical protein